MAIVQAMCPQPNGLRQWLRAREVASRAGVSVSTVKRHLAALRIAGQIVREGQGRATRYSLARSVPSSESQAGDVPRMADVVPWSSRARALRGWLQQPLGARPPVGYSRAFVDEYIPNQTSLLPASIAQSLAEEGRMQGQQPAGTYAQQVWGSFLIDLSWASSRLEGNRYSLRDTEVLFKRGTVDTDVDAVMLLNHKAAIEFLVEAVPEYGMSTAAIHHLHALLMQDLLADAAGLGAIRRKVVSIRGTAYIPLQAPSFLEDVFERIQEKARRIKNPVECAFFLWVNLAYLQPFEDGNKRTSRLAANIPLMLANCAPLSFLDVRVEDYATAMLGIYERCDASVAVELFAWTYRRSMAKYARQVAAVAGLSEIPMSDMADGRPRSNREEASNGGSGDCRHGFPD